MIAKHEGEHVSSCNRIYADGFVDRFDIDNNSFCLDPDSGIINAKEATGFGKVLENKWYVDELYDKIIVKPLNRFAGFLNNIFEKYMIDGFVNGVGRAGELWQPAVAFVAKRAGG